MNDSISWDPSLVKKYSSSNHFKLLNQLRNEVKKYPLNNKKRSKLSQSNGINLETKVKSNVLQSQNQFINKNSNQIIQASSNKTTVSFNNAKNFSIYNNNNNRQNESVMPDNTKSDEDSSSSSFKDRLNQIDMK
tara:strand:- start:162 stop:563 length:402 start_codon:yes stop_codon:yes gene_type:complete